MVQALLMQSVSDEIEFPKQWMRDAWNTHFMSPLSVSIMQDLYWWVLRTLHCLRSLLGVTGSRVEHLGGYLGGWMWRTAVCAGTHWVYSQVVF